MAARDRIIFALDVGDEASALKWLDTLKGRVGFCKVGLELFVSIGPRIVHEIKGRGIKCFLDLKFHDIPNTVSGALRSATRLGVDMVTVHASGGMKMLKAAVETSRQEAEALGISPPMVVGVTVLTSLAETDLKEVGLVKPLKDQVRLLSSLVAGAGLDGIVCSPGDIRHVRPAIPSSCVVITPGIRPSWSAKGDQSRVATPRGAIEAGADFLVIGRPIRQAPDPIKAIDDIVSEIEA